MITKYIILLNLLLSLTLQCPGTKYCRMCTSFSKTSPYLCNQCEHSTFNIINSRCEKTDQRIKNCKIYKNTSILKCSICKYGYTLINNKCKKCEIDNCAICDENIKKCLGCFNKNIFYNEICDVNLKCLDKNCDICGSNGLCFRCKSNFSLSKGYCVEGLMNCLFLKPGSLKKCQICDFGYYITRSWKCKPNIETVSKLKYVFIFGIGIAFVVFFIYCYLKEEDHYEEDSFLMIDD